MATVIIIFGCARDAYILNPSSRFLKKCKATLLRMDFVRDLYESFVLGMIIFQKNDNILMIIFSFIHHSLISLTSHHLSQSNSLTHNNIAYDDNTIR